MKIKRSKDGSLYEEYEIRYVKRIIKV